MPGRISGGLFAISSLGNIVGILVTTFFLIPSVGTRAITAGFAVFLLLSALVSLARGRSARANSKNGPIKPLREDRRNGVRSVRGGPAADPVGTNLGGHQALGAVAEADQHRSGPAGVR